MTAIHSANSLISNTLTQVSSLKSAQNNPIFELQKLISKIFAQMARISQADSEKTDALQKEYQILTKESASLIRKTGNASPWIATTGLVFLAASFYPANPDAKKLAEFISTQTPRVGEMFTSKYQAQGKEKDNLASLKLQMYVDKMGKKQSEGNSRQDYLKLLDAALASQKEASRAG